MPLVLSFKAEKIQNPSGERKPGRPPEKFSSYAGAAGHSLREVSFELKTNHTVPEFLMSLNRHQWLIKCEQQF